MPHGRASFEFVWGTFERVCRYADNSYTFLFDVLNLKLNKEIINMNNKHILFVIVFIGRSTNDMQLNFYNNTKIKKT